MTLEMAIIALARVAGSLPVLRWPFYGGVLAILVDLSDLFMMNLLDLGGVHDYQSFDKYLDQVYLLAFLIVALRWQGTVRNIAVALYLYRLAGFIAFETSSDRDLLLFFPNLFEVWFIAVAAFYEFDLGRKLSRPLIGAGVALLVVLKLGQEYAIHHAKWLDGFTAVEVVEAIWRFLTPPY